VTPQSPLTTVQTDRKMRIRGLAARRLAEHWLDDLASTTDPIERIAVSALARDLCRLADRTRGTRSLRGWL
jgi:hypothetical protein